MSAMKLFQKDNFKVRTIVVGGVTHYVANDLCDPLGIQNIRKKTALLDDDEKRMNRLDTASGVQNTTVLTEPGLYSLILSCRNTRKQGTAAWKFRRWVVHEVLPQIRQKGEYKIARLTQQLANSQAELANKDIELADSQRELQFVEDNRLYKVAFRMQSVRSRPNPFNFVKARARVFRDLLIWRDNIPFIRVGCVQQVMATLASA